MNKKTDGEENPHVRYIRSASPAVVGTARLTKQEDPELAFRVFSWLRARHDSSRIYHLNLPVLIQNAKHGEKIAAVDPTEVGKYLDLDDAAIFRLTKYFFYPIKQITAQSNVTRLDRVALARQYTALIESGVVESRAGLARYFGVSRAWITKVMHSLDGEAKRIQE